MRISVLVRFEGTTMLETPNTSTMEAECTRVPASPAPDVGLGKHDRDSTSGISAAAQKGGRPAAPPPAKRPRRLPDDEELAKLEAALGYQFKDKWLLRQAVVHPSYGEWNNSRLTWLGDAVLTAAASDLLYFGEPDATTAELHDKRCAAVRREACAVDSRLLGLERVLVYGRGYGGAAPSLNMVAEAYEGVWGAVYEDAGRSLDTVKRVYAALRKVPLV